MSPVDKDSYFGGPDLFTPEYDEIHISVTFTWDTKRAWELAWQWEHIAPVKIGGVAINGEGGEFTPGMYLRKGVTVTSRGCPNKCSWCFVKKSLRELEVKPGNNILDNNLLACSGSHLNKVFSMLKEEKEINFSGGLEAMRITAEIVEQLRGLRMKRLYLAYDQKGRFRSVEKAYKMLRKYFSREQVSCYVLIGYNGDTMDQAEGRLNQILDLGGIPFAMLYRNHEGKYPEPELRWRRFQRLWVRPAGMRYKTRERISE